MMRESKQVDAIGMILQSIDWSTVRMSATSPAGERFLADGAIPSGRLSLTVVVTVDVDPDRTRPGQPATGRVAQANYRSGG